MPPVRAWGISMSRRCAASHRGTAQSPQSPRSSLRLEFFAEPGMTDLVVTPQEYVDVLNLYSALNLSSDEGDSEWYASCFTEDGGLHGTHEVKGREALPAWKKKDKASRTNV